MSKCTSVWYYIICKITLKWSKIYVETFCFFVLFWDFFFNEFYLELKMKYNGSLIFHNLHEIIKSKCEHTCSKIMSIILQKADIPNLYIHNIISKYWIISKISPPFFFLSTLPVIPFGNKGRAIPAVYGWKLGQFIAGTCVSMWGKTFF